MRVAAFLEKVCIAQTPVQALAVDALKEMDKLSFRELMREMALQERFASALRGFDSKDRHPETMEPLDEE
jgi:hypothetical protein